MVMLLLAGAVRTEASHAMGADLTYQCIGGNTYRVRFSFYRDCIGIMPPASVYISVRSASCNRNIGVTCFPIPGTGQQVTNLCPSLTSTCNGGTFTGIQEWVYEGVITLPVQCADWVFSYNLCCRNAAITTINNPGASTFFIYATLNNLNGICNSAPTFTNRPVPFACLGQQLCFNHGATDPDGDSLVYQLVNPQQTATSSVNYIAPFSAVNPLASNPAIAFNNATGDICFTPTQQQVTVMAVLVKEYRNGVMIGSVVRDIQVTIVNCNNALPVLTGINGTNDFDVTVCANSNLCFNVNSSDANAGQQLTLQSNNLIPGATLNVSGGNQPVGTFCWSPTQNDISNTPYCFTISVRDDACPYNGSNIYAYCVTVAGLQVSLGPDRTIACNTSANVSAAISGATGPVTYQWSNGTTGATQNLSPGTYVVTASDGSCTARDTITISSSTTPTAGFSWTGACAGATVQYSDQSASPGPISSWTWNFGDGSTSQLQNPSHTYAANGTYSVSLVVESNSGCRDTIVRQVTLAGAPLAAFTSTPACEGAMVVFSANQAAGLTAWSWSFSNGSSASGAQASVVFNTPGTHTATLSVTDSQGCTGTVTQSIVVSPSPSAVITAPLNICRYSPVQFSAQAGAGASGYLWDFGDGNSSALQQPWHTYSAAGTYNISLIVTNAAGCSDTVRQMIQVNEPPVANAGPDVAICLGESAALNATGGVQFNWLPVGQTGATISVSPTAATDYMVTVTDANGCSDIDTVRVTVNTPPVPVVSPDRQICSGDSVVLIAGGGMNYLWNPSGSNNDTLTVFPTASATYAVNVIDGNGCLSTGFVNVTVQPNPVVSLPPGVFICNNSFAVLDAGSSGTSYQWNTGAASQSITATTQGTYSVTVTNSAGCSTTATSQVTVGGQVVSNSTPVDICAGQTAVLDAGPNAVSYQWSNGSGSRSIAVQVAGSYTVTITDANGCTGSVTHTVRVNPLPQAAFIPQDECLNDSVYFFDVSVVNGGSIVSWSWNLGDGNVSFARDPVHVYNAPGSYTIGLTVTSDRGCTSSLSDTLNIYPMPTAAFQFTQGCVGASLSFNDASTVGFGNMVKWRWSFGDGDSSYLQHPTHAYAQPGNYQVNLEVETPGGCRGSASHILQVYPQPDASFTINPSPVCAGGSVTVANNSSSTNGVISSWLWNLGNGQTSVVQHPSAIYPQPGTYPITLIATTIHGCSDTLTQSLTVNALPQVQVSPPLSICEGQSAVLSAVGGGDYLWFPSGATSASISVSPSANALYRVSVTNQAGCSTMDSVAVTVRTLPVADAGPDIAICSGASVTLTATGGVDYIWQPGSVNNASMQVSPVTTTAYAVAVTGVNGCTASDSVIVTVHSNPLLSLGADTVLCAGSTLVINAGNWQNVYWHSSGSNSSSLIVTPDSTITYGATVTDANGCIGSDSLMVTVSQLPVVAGGNRFYCPGSSVILDAGISGLNYEWAPGGETTQSISVNTSGMYTVVVTGPGGCQGSGNFLVLDGGVGLSGTPIFTQACQGDDALLDAGNPGSSYLWSTGATTRRIVVNTAGPYQVTVTDSTGCSVSFVNQVSYNPRPVAGFQVSGQCAGDLLQFSSTSGITSGNIVSWSWNLGNGWLSTSPQVSTAFNQPGNYPVSLVVVSGAGCADTVSGAVSVEAAPAAAFSAPQVCEGVPVQFTDLSSSAGSSVRAWNWSFGDGAIAQLSSPAHLYAAPGSYSVSLVVTSQSGCRDTVVSSVIVHPRPTAMFIVPPVCEGDSSRFANTTPFFNGVISDVNWDFGDGAGSADLNPVYRYAAPGTYTVTLTMGTSQGCEDVHQDTVNVHAQPQVIFNAPTVCQANVIQFSQQSTVQGGWVSSWYWDFGDGGFSSQPLPVYSYQSTGAFAATLAAMSDRGCSASVMDSVFVNALPVVAFVATNACEGAVTQFQPDSASLSQNIQQWAWDFGDGNGSAMAAPAHQFSVSGTYSVRLTAVTSDGCIDSVAGSVNVFPSPQAAFSAPDMCFSAGVPFTDQTTVIGGSSLAYSWDLGDGTFLNDANPVHMYNAPGVFNVGLTVTTPYGCSASVVQEVEVFPLPVPAFSVSNACYGAPVLLLDQSGIASGVVAGWEWDLGDSTVSQAQHPTHFYSSPGYYLVSLNAFSDQGCSARFADTVEIFAAPEPQPVASAACAGSMVSLTDTSTGAANNIMTWSWDFGDGSTSSLQSPQTVYSAAGQYLVVLETTNLQGCRGRAVLPLSVSAIPAASFGTGAACLNSPVHFTSTSVFPNGQPGTAEWDFGDGSTSGIGDQVAHSYLQAGTYQVMLVVTSQNGCSDTVINSVTVAELPVADFVATNFSGCGPLEVAFSDSSRINPGIISDWYWEFGDGGTSTAINPVHTYNEAGSYDVSLTVTSDAGCLDTVVYPQMILVHPGPEADFIIEPAEQTILNPEFSFINMSSGAMIWDWSFGDGGSSSAFEPVYTYRDTGSYLVKLLVTNSVGCTDSVYMPLRVNPVFSVWVPNAFTPNGDGENEVFHVIGEYIDDVELRIYDRWGEMIFIGNGLDKAIWDGRVARTGELAQQGVYVYLASVKDVWGTRHERTGHVSLVR